MVTFVFISFGQFIFLCPFYFLSISQLSLMFSHPPLSILPPRPLLLMLMPESILQIPPRHWPLGFPFKPTPCTSCQDGLSKCRSGQASLSTFSSSNKLKQLLWHYTKPRHCYQPFTQHARQFSIMILWGVPQILTLLHTFTLALVPFSFPGMTSLAFLPRYTTSSSKQFNFPFLLKQEAARYICGCYPEYCNCILTMAGKKKQYVLIAVALEISTNLPLH